MILLCAAPVWAISPTDTVREILMQNAATATGNGTPVAVDYFKTVSVNLLVTNTATVTWEVSIDGIHWNTGYCVNSADVTATPATTATVSGLYHCNLSALTMFRARVSAYTSGSISAYARITPVDFGQFKLSSGGGGGGGGGAVTVTSGTLTGITNPVSVTGTFWQATQPVSGTFWQATQPVSIASMPSTPVTGAFWQATQPVSGTFWQATQPVSIASMPSTAVTGTFWQATQPVSGTFWQATQPVSASSLPLPTGAATSANQDGIIKDGTGDTTQANVTTGRLNVDGSGVTQPVSGTFWQATQPVSGTFWQATQPVSGTFWQATQPVSASALPLPTGAATSANQDGIIRDGTGDTTQANVTSGRLNIDGSGVTQPVSGTFWQATQPVSGTVTTTPPSNASTNLAQIAGTTTDTNSGVKSAGTIRVVLATDQPALTNKLLVTPDSVALPANQSVNLAQVGGTNTVNGGLAGSQSIGGTAATNAAITQNPLIIGCEANSGQPAAATTGNQRQCVMTLDGALYVRVGGPIIWSCNLNAIGTTLTQCQAAPGANLSLYITDITAISNTSTAGLHTVRFGTGSNCGTGTGNLFFASASALLASPANSSTFGPSRMFYTTPIKVTANNAVCVVGVVTNTTNIQINGFTAP